MSNEKIQIFMAQTGEIFVKEREIVWIWLSNGDGPMLVSEDCLNDHELVLIHEKNRNEWNRHRYNMKKLWSNRRF